MKMTLKEMNVLNEILVREIDAAMDEKERLVGMMKGASDDDYEVYCTEHSAIAKRLRIIESIHDELVGCHDI